VSTKKPILLHCCDDLSRVGSFVVRYIKNQIYNKFAEGENSSWRGEIPGHLFEILSAGTCTYIWLGQQYTISKNDSFG